MVHLICVNCNRANPSDAKFCSGCGAGLLRKFCPQCRAVNGSDALFCAACGAALPEAPVPEALIASRASHSSDGSEAAAEPVLGPDSKAHESTAPSSSQRSDPGSAGAVDVELVESGFMRQAMAQRPGLQWAEPVPSHPLVPVAPPVNTSGDSHTARLAVLGVCTALVGAAAVLLWQRAHQPLEQVMVAAPSKIAAPPAQRPRSTEEATTPAKIAPVMVLPATAAAASTVGSAGSSPAAAAQASDAAAPMAAQAQPSRASETRPAQVAKPATELAPQGAVAPRAPQAGIAKPAPLKALPVQSAPPAAALRQECTATLVALALCSGPAKNSDGAEPTAPTGR